MGKRRRRERCKERTIPDEENWTPRWFEMHREFLLHPIRPLGVVECIVFLSHVSNGVHLFPLLHLFML